MDKRKYIPNSPEEFLTLQEREAPGFPLRVDIELTSRCNFNCTFCDKQHLLKPGQLGDIDEELFRRIIDQCAAGGVESIGLSYRGEPLLHRRAPQLVAYAKAAGIPHVSFCTNGMLLIPLVAEKLIQAGLDEITVSAQGHTAESFEYSRLGASFPTVLRNMDAMMERKRRMGARLPLVRVQAVEIPELDKESFHAFWQPRCDKVVTVPYRPPCEGEAPDRGDWCCSQPWHRLTVEWDGTILPCNNNDGRAFALGNAAEISLAEAWNSPRMLELRALHEQGLGAGCADCRVCTFRSAALWGMKDGCAAD